MGPGELDGEGLVGGGGPVELAAENSRSRLQVGGVEELSAGEATAASAKKVLEMVQVEGPISPHPHEDSRLENLPPISPIGTNPLARRSAADSIHLSSPLSESSILTSAIDAEMKWLEEEERRIQERRELLDWEDALRKRMEELRVSREMISSNSRRDSINLPE